MTAYHHPWFERRNRTALAGLAFTAVLLSGMVTAFGAGPAVGDDMHMTRPPPDPRGGQAYRIRYRVPVPLDVYWRFKTDFNNDFVATNPHILQHRFIYRKGNVAVTENRYRSAPDTLFRWETTVFPTDHRLEFALVNAAQCGHRFHYGRITMTPLGDHTVVVQEAYFDFLGATFWARYPWSGGMTSFLRDTVRWERRTVEQMADRYQLPRDDPGAPWEPNP